MYKKRLKNKHLILLIVFLFILIVIFYSSTLTEDKKLNKFESLIKDSVSGVEKILFYPFRGLSTKISEIKELDNIRKKYDILKEETSRIDSLYAENIELRKQIDSLKKELNITNTLNEYTYLNATVINRNVSSWYNEITIDKGSYNGIKEDMVVVNAGGLIGKVVAVSTFTSNVRLITTSNTNNKISITISDGINSASGLIKNYNLKTGYLEVEGISNTEKVNIDASVYTSGFGGIFPSGILIGKVKNITTDEYDLAKLIDVSPSADFDDINYVAVLKRKETS